MAQSLERSRTRVRGFADAEMDFQLMRQLGSVRYGGASVGQCLALAATIDDADPASWQQAFAQSAQAQEADAQARLARGHDISARDQYLIASNSYRAAEYYSPIQSDAHRALGLASRRCFLAALRAGGTACNEHWFVHAGLRLPAYHIRAAGRSRGLLAIVSGFDGTLEETWIVYGAAAAERGYDVLLFTVPGQMDTWRFNACSHFIPDVERVGAKMLDWALAADGAAAPRVALMGISFGGYFATRMAAHDARLAALIPNSPIIDLHAYMTSFIGTDPANLPDDQDIGLEDLAHIPATVMDDQTRAMAGNLMRRFGQPTLRASYRFLRQFRVDTEALARIRCPCLALVGEGEGDNPLRQLDHFTQGVRGRVARHIFTAAQGADGHCQAANPAFSAAVSMDWLDEALA